MSDPIFVTPFRSGEGYTFGFRSSDNQPGMWPGTGTVTCDEDKFIPLAAKSTFVDDAGQEYILANDEKNGGLMWAKIPF